MKLGCREPVHLIDLPIAPTHTEIHTAISYNEINARVAGPGGRAPEAVGRGRRPDGPCARAWPTGGAAAAPYGPSRKRRLPGAGRGPPPQVRVNDLNGAVKAL